MHNKMPHAERPVDAARRRRRPQVHDSLRRKVHTVPISPSLLEILCCPADSGGRACHGHLRDLGDSLLCTACGLVYPIEDGIPVLLIERGRPSTDFQANRDLQRAGSRG